MKYFISTVLMAIPVLVLLHLAFPGEWQWHESLSCGVVSGMVSTAWLRVING